MVQIIKKLFLIFLLVLIIIGVYYFFFRDQESSDYLDTIDAVTSSDGLIFAVGRNNNNDQKLTKAKFTIYDEQQQKIYERVYNKGYRSQFYDIALAEDDVVVVGRFDDSKKDYQNHNSTALLLKYSHDGELLFEKRFDGVSNSKFVDVISIDDGYLVFGTGKKDQQDIGLLLKYYNDGTLAWEKEFTEGNSEFSSAIVVDEKIYVVGRQNHHGLLVMYTMDGTLEQYITYEDTDSLGFSDIVEVDRYLVVTTGIKESNDKVLPGLIRYDLDLEYVNEISYTSEHSGRFLKVVKDSNDDLVVLGSTSENKKNDNVIHHSYIGKYRSNLTEAQVVPYYNEEDDYFTDIILMDDSYLVSGYSYYPEQGYLGKFLSYSSALKLLEVK